MATAPTVMQSTASFNQLDYSATAKRVLARKPALFINNEWVRSSRDSTLAVEDPSVGREITRIVDASKADVDRAKIKAGTVWGNCHAVIDPALPFGGYKQSGIGREQGRQGVEAYTEVKTVIIRL
jgi:acyl-CoA reductase-like NAD-dependent aldehyde dehydrogenase